MLNPWWAKDVSPLDLNSYVKKHIVETYKDFNEKELFKFLYSGSNHFGLQNMCSKSSIY